MKFWILLAFVGLALLGCATSSSKMYDDQKYTPKEVSQISILHAEPDRPFKVIGEIKGKGALYASEEDMRKEMIKEAAQMGADAIIVSNDSYHVYDPVGYHRRLKGQAIRWTGSPSEKKEPVVAPTPSYQGLPNPQPVR